MSTGTQLHIMGLSEMDLLELEEQLPDADVGRVAAGTPAKNQHGDLGLTIAVVVVTSAVVHGLSVWLAKRRVEDVNKSNISFEKLPDGTVRLNVSTMSRGTVSEAPDPKVVEALKAQLSEVLQQQV